MRILIAVIIATLAGCAPKVKMSYNQRATLRHTYSIFIYPENPQAKQFVSILREHLKWEQYLYLPKERSEADSTMGVLLKEKKVGSSRELHLTLNIRELSENNTYTIKVLLSVPDRNACEIAARHLAHHMDELLVLPPDANAGTLYYNLSDPSCETK